MHNTNWNIPVTNRLDKQVEEAVKEGYASTKSELVRFAVVSYLRFLKETDNLTKTGEKYK